MKTTLELPDPLLRKVKATAAGNGQTMTAFITAALEAKLMQNQQASSEKPWMAFAGVFSDCSQESAKIMDRVKEGCETIDPENWK